MGPEESFERAHKNKTKL